MFKMTNHSDTPRSFTTPLGVFAAAPDGGSCEVPDDAAKLLAKDLTFAAYVDDEVLDLERIGGADADDEEDDTDGLDKLTVPQLKELAESEDIDIGEATKKADIISVIRETRAATPPVTE